MPRDNFLQAIKRALAERAGFRCSYPGCSAVTVGPSEESDTSTSNTGEAAHIAAASAGKGARRFDPNMTSAQRSAIDNGIWCCNTHAKLIDTDETTYSVQMLKQWKLLAERRAQLRQAYGVDIDSYRDELISLGLAQDNLVVANDNSLSEKIGNAVSFSWMADICGKPIANVLRDFLIEYSRNAFTHGGATTVNIEFHSNSIKVFDDGIEFPLSKLRSVFSRGGGKSLNALLHIKALGQMGSHRTENGMNALCIPFVLEPFELPNVNPCAINLNREMVRSESIDASRFVSCDRAFVVAPNYACYSDGPLYERMLQRIINEHPNVVLILPEASEQVIAHFREIFPSVVIESW